MLDFEIVDTSRWDPVFYMLQELRLNQKFLPKPSASNCLLHMVDYFVDYNQTRPELNPKIFLIYEDFHSNLRDILEYRRANRMSYPEPTMIRLLFDLSTAVYSLHRRGNLRMLMNRYCT